MVRIVIWVLRNGRWVGKGFNFPLVKTVVIGAAGLGLKVGAGALILATHLYRKMRSAS